MPGRSSPVAPRCSWVDCFRSWVVTSSQIDPVARIEFGSVAYHDFFSGIEPGFDFDHAILFSADPDHAIVGDAVSIYHEHSGNAGALKQCCLGHADTLPAAYGEAHTGESAAAESLDTGHIKLHQMGCLLYTSPSPRDG